MTIRAASCRNPLELLCSIWLPTQDGQLFTHVQTFASISFVVLPRS